MLELDKTIAILRLDSTSGKMDITRDGVNVTEEQVMKSQILPRPMGDLSAIFAIPSSTYLPQ